jgi:hypothetical protein
MLRVPGKSEASAFHIALAVGLLAATAVIAAVAVTPLYGLAVLGAGAIAATAYELLGRDPDPPRRLRDATLESHAHGAEAGMRHVLVVANETLAGPGLRDEIVRQAGPRVQIDILAPVLTSRLHYWSSDFDAELADARRRLDGSLAWAASQGLEARGEVGDPDPFTALEDELRDFGADAVIVVTHPRDRANRLEARELARLRRELDVPVAHVVADGARGSIEIES